MIRILIFILLILTACSKDVFTEPVVQEEEIQEETYTPFHPKRKIGGMGEGNHKATMDRTSGLE